MEHDFVPAAVLGLAPTPEIGQVGGRFDAVQMALRRSGRETHAQVADFGGGQFESEQGDVCARIGVPAPIVAAGGSEPCQTVADAIGGEDSVQGGLHLIVGVGNGDVAARGVAAQTVKVLVYPERTARFDADGCENAPAEEQSRAGSVDESGFAEDAVVPNRHEREFEGKTGGLLREFMNDSLQNHLLAVFCLALVLSFGLRSLIPIIVLTSILVVTALFHLLWNGTVPGIFGLRRITFWESFRLLLMAWLLFGGVFFRLAVH